MWHKTNISLLYIIEDIFPNDKKNRKYEEAFLRKKYTKWRVIMMEKMRVILFLVFILSIIQISVGAIEDNVINWDIPELKELGINSTMLNKMDEELEYEYSPYRNINSVVVIKDGQLIFENYYNGYDQNTLFEVKSVTKTITSALTGIAIDKGYIEGVNEKVVDYFPEYFSGDEGQKFNEVTIKHLLTMSEGIEWDNSEEGRKEFFTNPKKYLLGLEFVEEPGKVFSYNETSPNILSRIITKTTDMKASEFADKYLFGPLGIEDRFWYDHQGYTVGGSTLQLRTRDMAKIGYLYLNNGKWNGEQIISEKWINESTQAHINPRGRREYGYYIWIDRVITGDDVYFAAGYGGQYIFVVEEYDLVIAINSRVDKDRWIHREIIDKYIIPALLF